MSDMPYYIDDPLVDTAAHRLDLQRQDDAQPGAWAKYRGVCSCAQWTAGPYDEHGVLEAFDMHMGQVQEDAHRAERARQQPAPHARSAPEVRDMIATLIVLGRHPSRSGEGDPSRVALLAAAEALVWALGEGDADSTALLARWRQRPPGVL